MRLVAGVVVLLAMSASHAFAKPTIRVSVKIDANEKRLREKLTRDLKTSQGAPSMERFFEERFIETFSRLEMFNFVNSDVPGAIKLSITVASRPSGLRYPREDVLMTLSLEGDPQKHEILLFQKCTCGMPPCAPENLSDWDWYRRVFRKRIQEWPQGLFKTIVLGRNARYEQGKVRTIETLSELGQADMKPPSAVFEIAYGENFRWFAPCRSMRVDRWNTLGFDQGNPQQFIVPVCVTTRVADVPDGDNGQVTLLRAFLR